MSRRNPGPPKKLKRPLRLENLESRKLLAADISGLSEATLGQSNFVASSTDAGSTRSTAFDLGTVQESVSLRGSVSFNDRLDLFRFDVSRDGTVDIDLTGLRSNADLLLADESGSVFAISRGLGRSSESISTQLSAGTYYVGVSARSFWGTSYRLNLDAVLVAPTPEPELEPGNGPEGEDVGTGNVSPLADAPYFGGTREWNVNAVGAPEAWQAGFTGEGITVAVVDTGVDLDHPDLVNNLYVNPGEIRGNGIDDDGNGFIDDVHGYDFASRDADPNDVGGHGTHVAGSIAAGLNGFGATGIAPNATILPVRVLGNNGSGSTASVAAGIRYAADQGADIINLSLGGGFSRSIQSAINYAQSLGSFIVAAAGNESAATPSFPAQFSSLYDNVISVGAHNRSGQIAGFSNDVGNSGSLQIDAPGVGVYSTYVGGRYATLSGTSMASPHVAGVAALALSANPDLTPSQLRNLLTAGVTSTASGSDAIGIANAATTVAYAAAGLTTGPVASASTSTSVANRIGNARSASAISINPLVVSDFLTKASSQEEYSTIIDVDPEQFDTGRNTSEEKRTSTSSQTKGTAEAIDIAIASHVTDSSPDDESSIDERLSMN